MTRQQQRQKAEAFLGLHQAPPILVLPNAWDVASARIFQLEGCKAIGTTSAGIAATLGYPDGQRMSPGGLSHRMKRIDVGRADLRS